MTKSLDELDRTVLDHIKDYYHVSDVMISALENLIIAAYHQGSADAFAEINRRRNGDLEGSTGS